MRRNLQSRSNYSVFKYLESPNDPNTNNPNLPFIPDIFYGSRTGNLVQVKEFVDANPNSVHYVDRYGTSHSKTLVNYVGNRALYYACLCGHPAVVRFLLQSGDPIDLKTIEGQRYYLASLTDGRRIVEISNKIEIRNIVKISPIGGFTMNKFLEAAEKGNVTMFQGLLKKYKSFMGLKESDNVDLSDIVDMDGFEKSYYVT
jgi:ankyrin repeat protein